MSFLVQEAIDRLSNSNLIKVSKLIQWESLRAEMGNLGRSGYGPEGYDPLKMLKAIILQSWHSLSDAELEEAIRVRLDFMVITELIKAPDETTICRFRNLLIKQKLMDKLLRKINEQLECEGLKIQKSQGAIIDATLITSAACPRRELKATPLDREENEIVYSAQGEETLSKDPDATWLKKGKKSYFGYKGFAVVDKEDGYINHTHVTSAHISEVKELANILPNTKISGRLYADKGYASTENKELLKRYGIANGIMEKAHRNKPLRHSQRCFNRLISKVRYKVEQGFGTLKRKFRFDRASYFTTAKVHAQMILKAIAFNLLKALNKIIRPKSVCDAVYK